MQETSRKLRSTETSVGFHRTTRRYDSKYFIIPTLRTSNPVPLKVPFKLSFLLLFYNLLKILKESN
jgi:hypothetical protein